VLSDVRSRAVWLIDLGHPYLFLPEWRVFTLENGTARSPCAVMFRPEMKTPLALMPEPVRALASSLDEALGPGENDGTLQPTARIRTSVAQAWANASLRPWSLTDPPYNTRRQVEAGLTQWARNSSRRTALHRTIQGDYPKAQRALTTYYKQRFGLSATQARELASFVSDHMLRLYFIFPIVDGEGYARASQNPWPNRSR
jgi:hypothetical protein